MLARGAATVVFTKCGVALNAMLLYETKTMSNRYLRRGRGERDTGEQRHAEEMQEEDCRPVPRPLGSGVDAAVRRVETAYSARGMVATVTQFDATSGGDETDQVAYTYDGWGQLTDYQQDNDDLVTGTSGANDYGVRYAWTKVSGAGVVERHGDAARRKRPHCCHSGHRLVARTPVPRQGREHGAIQPRRFDRDARRGY